MELTINLQLSFTEISMSYSYWPLFWLSGNLVKYLWTAMVLRNRGSEGGLGSLRMI